MKKILISSFIISCYILLVYIFLGVFVPTNTVNTVPGIPGIGIFLFIITIALAIANIVNAIVTALNYKNNLLLNNWYSKAMLVFKLIMIPFFVLNFIMWYLAVALVFLF